MALVELDVPALEPARRAVDLDAAVRETNGEGVVRARLAVVADVHLVGETAVTVHFCGALDSPRVGVERDIGSDFLALHLRALPAVVLIGEVAAELAVLDSAGHAEIAFRPGRRADPSAAGHAIRGRIARRGARGAATAQGDVGAG